MFTRLHTFLTAPIGKTARSTTIFWFCLSLTCATALALLALQRPFSSEYVVQDDVRQHVFWMQRFVDPSLFPNDLIANYFQSVAPWGYTTVYQVLSAIGIHPLLASKLLPLPLALITTAFCFGTSLQILPVPLAGFISSVLLNQNLLRSDDLYSATPRAFLYPFFLVFLYFLLKRSVLPCAIAMAGLGLFYPQVMFMACGVLILSLVRWEQGRLRLSPDRQDFLICGVGLASATIALLIYVLQQDTSQFGPAIGVAEAKQLPEFWGSGRLSFFNNDPMVYWVTGQRSGLFPRPDRLFAPVLILIGFLLPILLRFPNQFPLVQQVTGSIRVLWLMLLASVGLYFMAHLLLFKLHLPSRYTQHSFRIVLVLAAGIVLTVLIDSAFRWAALSRRSRLKSGLAIGTASLVGLLLISFPLVYPRVPGYTKGRAPELYQFFAQQPKDIVIASIAREADFIPTFSQRSVLAAQEYGIVYHQGYYNQFRERMTDILQAQYSADLNQVRAFTNKYGIDFWLLDKDAFKPKYFKSKAWIQQQYEPAAQDAIATLNRNIYPVVEQAMERCAVFSQNKLVVLQADCVVKETSMAQ